MLESATLMWAILAFASFHAAEVRRRPVRFRNLAAACSPIALRAVGVLLLALSVTQWSNVEGLAAALLVVLAMFCGAATLFVLFAPLAPRVVWGLAIACAPAGLILSLLGVVHG
jgi:hypothetical protein